MEKVTHRIWRGSRHILWSRQNLTGSIPMQSGPQTPPTKMDGKTLMEHPSRTLTAPSAESPHPFKPSSVLAYLVKLSAKALSF